MSQAIVNEIIGDPRRLDEELREFTRNAEILSSRKEHLVGRYPRRWIAIYERDVKADGASLNEVLAKVDELGLPRDRTVISYIDKNMRRMILQRSVVVSEIPKLISLCRDATMQVAQ